VATIGLWVTGTQKELVVDTSRFTDGSAVFVQEKTCFFCMERKNLYTQGGSTKGMEDGKSRHREKYVPTESWWN
jgi:hypothetical protein